MTKQKKKSSCLGKILKCVGIFTLLIFVASFGVDDSKKETAQTNAPIVTATATQEAPTEAPSTAPTNTPKLKTPAQPSLPGSQVYDIVLSLEGKGIPKAKTQSSKDSEGRTVYQHASSVMDDSSLISYNITSDQNHAVSYAVFNVGNGEASSWYLPFCATMPYDGAEPEKAVQFVEDNMKTQATMQIGDAVFQMFPNENDGAMLTITASGYEEWCMDQIQ